MDLQRYFPYRLAVLAEQVSMAVAEVYTRRFDLTRHEWRILAALGDGSRIAATDIGRITTLDKMQVSRALESMERRGLVQRSEADGDRRKRIVQLTAPGHRLFAEIVPLALDRETALLATLTDDEKALLDQVMRKIAEAAGHKTAARRQPDREPSFDN
jgi:DNA-binding MarR family transcriptional regulator